MQRRVLSAGRLVGAVAPARLGTKGSRRRWGPVKAGVSPVAQVVAALIAGTPVTRGHVDRLQTTPYDMPNLPRWACRE